MAAKHTPGPWKTVTPKDSLTVRIADPEGHLDIGIGAESDGKRVIIAEAFGRVGSSIYVMAQANARLIAAAPDLLEAAKLALEAVESGLLADDPQAMTQMEWEAEPLASLRRAIHKAEVQL